MTEASGGDVTVTATPTPRRKVRRPLSVAARPRSSVECINDKIGVLKIRKRLKHCIGSFFCIIKSFLGII